MPIFVCYIFDGTGKKGFAMTRGAKTAHSCPITLNNSYNGVPPAPGTGMGQSLEWLGRAGTAASNTEYCSSIN